MVMVMMVVTVTPMMAMMSSVRLDHDRFPALFRLVLRRIGRRIVLCQ
jgi:hypothetical protein